MNEKLKVMISQGSIERGGEHLWICPDCLYQLGPMKMPFALERAATHHCMSHLVGNSPGDDAAPTGDDSFPIPPTVDV